MDNQQRSKNVGLNSTFMTDFVDEFTDFDIHLKLQPIGRLLITELSSLSSQADHRKSGTVRITDDATTRFIVQDADRRLPTPQRLVTFHDGLLLLRSPLAYECNDHH